MKKLMGFFIVFIMAFYSVSASAEMMVEEFDVKTYSNAVSENVCLMEDVKSLFEERITQGWANLESEINIYDLNISRGDIEAMYNDVLHKNPYYYYVTGNMGLGVLGGIVYYIKPVYVEGTNIEDVKSTWEEIDKATEEILLYISPEMTEYEKVMAVHDYMAYNYIYDVEDYEQNMLIMLDKRGVCAAYSYAFIHMMNVLGIDSYFVASVEMAHAWNLVCIDDKWYHIDVTWDHLSNYFAYVTHDYALLSTQAVIENGHYGFDTGNYICDSTLYDEDNYLSVYVNDMSYFIKDNNLVDEKGNIIYKNLDGGDGWWHIKSREGFPGQVYAALCEVNGILYFNTDTGIFSYDPANNKTEMVLEKVGVCGIFADKNIIRYNKFDTGKEMFVESGSIKVSDIKLGKPYYEDGEAIVRVYNDLENPLWIISNGEECIKTVIGEKSVDKIRFDNGDEQKIYIWKNNLEPVVERIDIK